MNKETQNRIISEISIESGLEPTTVKIVYTALVRYVLKKLKFKGICPLPDFGDFSLLYSAPKRTLNINTRTMETRGERKIIKFQADRKLKYYINEKV